MDHYHFHFSTSPWNLRWAFSVVYAFLSENLVIAEEEIELYLILPAPSIRHFLRETRFPEFEDMPNAMMRHIDNYILKKRAFTHACPITLSLMPTLLRLPGHFNLHFWSHDSGLGMHREITPSRDVLKYMRFEGLLHRWHAETSFRPSSTTSCRHACSSRQRPDFPRKIDSLGHSPGISITRIAEIYEHGKQLLLLLCPHYFSLMHWYIGEGFRFHMSRASIR